MLEPGDNAILRRKLDGALREVGELHMTTRELTEIVERQAREIAVLRVKYEPESLEPETKPAGRPKPPALDVAEPPIVGTEPPVLAALPAPRNRAARRRAARASTG